MQQLTQRELMYLEDFLKQEQLAIKCMNFYAQQCNDQSIKRICQDAAKVHQQNYQTMVKNLNGSTLQ